ncbi:diacylglycerol kinase [Streptomyces sp. NPDC053431]|uniref:diacylglycerol kinase n=1 Tax=Streptomyces sp. NPDC053431 TaxID=3365703 RepID=UPI0037D1C201
MDGESVRIAKDVLSAGAAAKICLPDSPEEFSRALSRRGSRRPVVLGDDRALLRTVTLLHREAAAGRAVMGGAGVTAAGVGGAVGAGAAGAGISGPGIGGPGLGGPGIGGPGIGGPGIGGPGIGGPGLGGPFAGGVLALVPIGAPDRLRTAHALGVPPGTVAAARAVLDGVVRRLDLLVDDSDGVVLDRLDVPASRSLVPAPPTVWDTCRSLVRTLVRPAPTALAERTHRLRVEADGVLLCDVDTPVEGLTVRALGGAAALSLAPAGAPPVRVTARTLTVTGPDFRYRADSTVSGPVRRRTWTVRPGAWGLTIPAPAPADTA